MIRAIIIDDEKKCISLLQKMLNSIFPEINIIAACSIPEEGIKAIRLHEPDIVFLDIEMPNKTGFEVLGDTRDIPFNVVFTTAYQQYAIKAIKFSALDYLLKPIDADELKETIFRFKQKHKNQQYDKQLNLLFNNLKNNSYNRLSLSTNEGVIFINPVDILYCEASGGYTFFFMKAGEKIITSKTMKDYEDVLPENQFFRIHHSYIINLSEIKRYIKGDGGLAIMSNNTELPVSKRKKEDFIKQLKL
ncbi:MAG: response regulator transcription factor [Bacteroidetes bacterium]|nr:response regulator transcription factor [Bacteroidota bacterium]MBS1669884.1 response regulator transcription factor [Bacteroidota bacterium]